MPEKSEPRSVQRQTPKPRSRDRATTPTRAGSRSDAHKPRKLERDSNQPLKMFDVELPESMFEAPCKCAIHASTFKESVIEIWLSDTHRPD